VLCSSLRRVDGGETLTRRDGQILHNSDERVAAGVIGGDASSQSDRRPSRHAKASDIAGWLLFSILILISFGYSAVRPLNPDVGWYLYATGRMLGGAPLYVDILDPNPPLVFYITAVPVWTAHLVGWSEGFTFKLFTAAAASWSFFACERLMARARTSGFRVHIFLSVLAFVFFIYPGGDDGQREHLMFIFVMPYVVASVCRVQASPIAGAWALLVGAVAGLGMALKPYFLLLWLSTEAYLRLVSRTSRTWQRPENVGITTVLIAYGAAILVFSRQYLDVAAMAARVYGAYGCGVADLLQAPATAMWIIGVLSFWLSRSDPRAGPMKGALVTAATAWLLIAFIQQKGWPYHFYPAEAALILLLTLTIPQVFPLKGWPARGSHDALRTALVRQALTWALLFSIVGLGVYKTVGNRTLMTTYWALRTGVAAARGRISLAQAVSTVRYRSYGASFMGLISLVRQHAGGQPIAMLSSSVYPAFPLVNHSETSWPLRFNCLWLLPGSYPAAVRPMSRAGYHAYDEMGEIEQFLFRSVIADLRTPSPPALLIVDSSRRKQGFGTTAFDFLDYFTSDPGFRQLLAQYEILTTVGPYVIYKRAGP